MLTLTSDAWLAAILEREVFRATFNGEPISDVERSIISKLAPRSFVYSKVSCSDVDAVRLLEGMGFRIIETALTFEKEISRSSNDGEGDTAIRNAKADDCEGVAQLAETAFTNSRFHKDSLLSAHANLVKREWVNNYFLGRRGDGLVVAEHEGQPAGFLQLLKPEAGLVIIDLIAVGAPFRGRGLATKMISFASSLHGCKTIRVGTQAHNIASVRLYEGLGFRLISATYVLHYHHGSARHGVALATS